MKHTRVVDTVAATKAMREFLTAIGEDMTDPNIQETPERVTKMYCEELLVGHTTDPKIKLFPTPNVGNQFVVVTDLQVNSLCSHHLMPIVGVAHIGAFFLEEFVPQNNSFFGEPPRSPQMPELYPASWIPPESRPIEPPKKVTTLPGLSKYQRITTRQSRRLQLQERLRNDIASDVLELLKADWCMVYIKAAHFCMIHRGVSTPNSQTTTTSIKAKDNITEKRARRLKKDFLREIAMKRV